MNADALSWDGAKESQTIIKGLELELMGYKAHLAEGVRLLEQVDRIESSGMPGGLDTSPIKKFLSSTPADSLARMKAMERVVVGVKKLRYADERGQGIGYEEAWKETNEALAEYDRLKNLGPSAETLADRWLKLLEEKK